MTVETGQSAVVSVATATLWAAPQEPDESTAPALRRPSGVREWVTSMSRDKRIHGLGGVTLSQLLFGDEVVVDAIEDGWAKVVVPGQPAAKHGDRGYPGWIPTDQLAAAPGDADGTEYIVDATATSLRDEPDGDVTVPGIILGTRLRGAGAPYRGWIPVAVPGQEQPAWVRGHDLSAAGPRRVDGDAVLTVASRLLEVPYVWGGMSAYGIDCSGLVHLVYRYLGVTVPRDADDQRDGSAATEAGQARPGDLYFFAKDGTYIHHVGIVGRPGPDGEPTIVHASGVYGKVVHEPFTGERRATLVGAGAVPVPAPAA